MKKSILSFALIAVAAMCVSCVQEINTDNGKGKNKSPNAIAFIIGSKATKAETKPVQILQTSQISFGYVNETTELFLTETVTSLDDTFEPVSPATKGTPVYTENVISQGSFDAVVYDADGENHLSDLDATYEYDEGWGSWRHEYESNPWTANPNGLWFFMCMGDQTGIATSGDGVPQYSVFEENNKQFGKIEFTYTSPDKAANQNDILFSSRPITKAQEDNGANALFYHALTAVKFRIGNTTNTTMITGVEFTGLAKTGDCTVIPYYTDDWTNDKPKSNPYGATGVSPDTKSAECVVWDTEDKATGTFSQTFTQIVNYTESENAPFGSSFYAAANDNNLNDANASLTFWFIPQTLTADVKLKISYTVDGVAFVKTIDFGDEAKAKNNGNYPTWKAGELRTYTLSANEVNVTVTDEVTSGNVKQNVVITNTGNVPCYIRAAIIGYWVDKSGNIINELWRPLSDGTMAWSDTDGAAITTPYQYLIAGSSLSTDADYYKNHWMAKADGFYYYKYQVPAGASTIGKLFDSYTPKAYDSMTSPNPEIKNAHLEIRVMVQAIQASKLIDGNSFKTGAAAYYWETNYFSTELDKK